MFGVKQPVNSSVHNLYCISSPCCRGPSGGSGFSVSSGSVHLTVLHCPLKVEKKQAMKSWLQTENLTALTLVYTIMRRRMLLTMVTDWMPTGLLIYKTGINELVKKPLKCNFNCLYFPFYSEWDHRQRPLPEPRFLRPSGEPEPCLAPVCKTHPDIPLRTMCGYHLRMSAFLT